MTAEEFTPDERAELEHYRSLAQRDPFEYRQGTCCGDAHMELKAAMEHIKILGFGRETKKAKNITEVIWHNYRAEKAEARNKELREALRKFGRHGPACESIVGIFACDCGWVEVEKLLSGEPETKEG
jgi:hypothetical protein